MSDVINGVPRELLDTAVWLLEADGSESQTAKELRALLTAQPQASAEQSAPVIDLDANAWESIKRAASESKWIPSQYFMGDWVADVCEFLRAGRHAQSAGVPDGWQPIENAPKDNLHPIWIAQFDGDGALVDIDSNAIWQSEQESWEIPQTYYFWASDHGRVEEPTHWAYMGAAPAQPAAQIVDELAASTGQEV